METLIVGGDFNLTGGKPSSIVRKLAGVLHSEVYNGGDMTVYDQSLEAVKNIDKLVIWMANIPNQIEKKYIIVLII